MRGWNLVIGLIKFSMGCEIFVFILSFGRDEIISFMFLESLIFISKGLSAMLSSEECLNKKIFK